MKLGLLLYEVSQVFADRLSIQPGCNELVSFDIEKEEASSVWPGGIAFAKELKGTFLRWLNLGGPRVSGKIML